MTEPQTPAAEEIYALRSVRDSHVIFSLDTGISDASRLFEKVGEHVVAVPRPRAEEISRLLFEEDSDDLIEVGHTIRTGRTISFRYRTVMLTPAGQAVLRAAGA